MSDGGGTSTTVVQPSGPTKEELELTRKQIELSEFQLEELRAQRESQAQFAEDIGPLLDLQFEQAKLALEQQAQLAPVQEELLQLALEDLRRGGAASPEQIRLIEEAGGAALSRGEFDINRFQTEGLTSLREELAPALGLRPSDTPILDRGSRVAAEALRQKGQLSQGVRGAEATARLNFPLAQSQLLQSSALGQQQLQEAIRQFQSQLSQQAFANRLASTSTLGGLGLGLAGIPQPQFPNFQQGFTQTTTSPGTGFGLTQAAQLAGGVGSVLAGIGSLTGSSRKMKHDKRPVDDELVLEKVSELPVEMWSYNPGLDEPGARHIGTYAEDFRDSFGLGDGKMLNLVDTTGVTMSAIKALDRKVKRLEASFGLAA